MFKLILIVLCFPIFLLGQSNYFQIEGGTVDTIDTYHSLEWNIVNLKYTYENPVVLTIPNNVGSNPANFRIRNITSNSFEMMLTEPESEDGEHISMTVSYIVVEAGEWLLPDGRKLIAGVHSTRKTIGIEGGSNDTITLPSTLTNPVILAQIQTLENEIANIPDETSDPWLTVNVQDVTNTEFKLSLERSESNLCSPTVPLTTLTKDEKIGWLAIDGGVQGNFIDDDGLAIKYETIIFNNTRGWSDARSRINFVNSYNNTPIFVATKQTRLETDGGWLRYFNLNSSGVELVVDEDRCDAERSHIDEVSGIFVFSENFKFRDEDPDHDGISSDIDNCPLVANAGQENNDGDTLVDACDNCPNTDNENQSNYDNDSLGDSCDPDQDNDGLTNAQEVILGTDPQNVDSDNDGLDDAHEDNDNDGENNITEIGTDTDGDGLDDAIESSITDTDGDGVDDEHDSANNDPCIPSTTSPTCDADNDGLTNAQEIALGTNPTVADTDGDGVDDGVEVGDINNPTDTDNDGKIDALESTLLDNDNDGVDNQHDPADDDACNPNNSGDDCDIDGDGLTNAQEVILGTNPTVADTDGDGVDDGVEVGDVNNPTDTDGDGKIDAIESSIEDNDNDHFDDQHDVDDDDSCVPRSTGNNCDSDHDGLSNAWEVAHGTNKDNADTDGDGIDDGTEVVNTDSPLDTDGDGKIDALESILLDNDNDGFDDQHDANDDNPCIPETSVPACDADNDGLTNAQEQTIGTNPTNADTDGDGVVDGDEVGDDFAHPIDTDNDGKIDALESSTRDHDNDGTDDEHDPNDNDSCIPVGDGDSCDNDDDGLTNGWEDSHGTNKDVADTDGDGIDDRDEVLDLNNPRDIDGDGKIDALESSILDNDNDGVDDQHDPADDDACIPNATGDDCDADNDGLTNAQEDLLGTDKYKADSDNDGINDIYEVGSDLDNPLNTDGDDNIDAMDPDDDNDGILTKDENPDPNGDNNPDDAIDTDEDGVVDYLDNDNDCQDSCSETQSCIENQCVDNCSTDSPNGYCSDGDICTDGMCVKDNSCTVDSDCLDNQVCTDGTCIEKVDCTLDSDCSDNQVCTDGICIEKVDCTLDSDCSDNQVCTDGTCIEKVDCTLDSDCSDNQVCTENQCVEKVDCTLDSDCSEDQICTNSICVDKESNDNEESYRGSSLIGCTYNNSTSSFPIFIIFFILTLLFFRRKELYKNKK